jgi:CRP/FNR family cyclic AMP-dependent transcriptional regulator
MQKIAYAAGDTILTEGEEGRTAFLVISGVVEVVVGNGARAKRVATLSAGEVFGEVSLLDPGPRSATVRAISQVECAVTSYDDFMSSIQADPEKAVAFMKTLVRRLRQTNEMLMRSDPQKRGIRAIIAGMQGSVTHALGTPDMSQSDWYEYGTV